MTQKTNYKIITLIIIASIIFGVLYNIFSSNGIPLIREHLIVDEVSFNSESDSLDGLKSLTLADVVQIHSRNIATFIDARDQWEFGEGHILGAINIPEYNFTPDNIELPNLGKENLIIIYCDGDECDISKRLASQLLKLGYKNCYIYLGGFNEWKAADLPVEGSNDE